MKRRRVIVGLAVMAVIAIVAVIPGSRGPRPCPATFEQVHEGMTYDEVCATVGGPPGVYSSRSRYTFLSVPPPAGHYHHEWRSADEILYVVFDASTGSAVLVHRFNPPPGGRNFFQRVRDRLGI
jgi:hypothetical protein